MFSALGKDKVSTPRAQPRAATELCAAIIAIAPGVGMIPTTEHMSALDLPDDKSRVLPDRYRRTADVAHGTDPADAVAVLALRDGSRQDRLRSRSARKEYVRVA